ncbi:CHAP domain-containing protein [Aurantiacibacter flavus]|uniref:CHAP domain-containing protein n=1 Tax=Aurantiacibacter flavus TaxID=3145232 RepID=A0ABV0D054_9SPHN
MMAALTAQPAQARLQCVPYARDHSGIAIHGNAHLWWSAAEGRYARGQEPQVGAVMAFSSSRAMPLGHVAVVSEVIDDRHILIDHANWSRPGGIETGVPVVDVSEAGDWSEVRVWYGPIGALGSRHNPIAGFIYADSPPAALPLIEVAEAEVSTNVGG